MDQHHDTTELRTEADAVLARLVGDPTGRARLREDQWRAVEALVAHRRRALVVQRTGWGKSAVYFVATSLLRARGSGPTVIVSPLLALMRNQVEAAACAGIHARTINSANQEDWETVQAEISAGSVDVLLVSPEALTSPQCAHRTGSHLPDSQNLIPPMMLMEDGRAEVLKITVPESGLATGLKPGVMVRPVELFATPWARIFNGQLSDGVAYRAARLDLVATEGAQ